jgi:hypothetical protein
MGTRNLTCAVINNDYKVAQFAQWDGYPSGQGIIILEFIRDKMDRPLMEKRLREITFLNDEEIELINESKKFPQQFSRDVGGRIFEFIQNGRYSSRELQVPSYNYKEVEHLWEMDKLFNQLSFAADSLFCEYAYVVDFDKNTFEVYKGFVKSPHTGERFSDMDTHKSNGDSQYYPVKHWKTFDLNDLPSNEVFLEELAENEED